MEYINFFKFLVIAVYASMSCNWSGVASPLHETKRSIQPIAVTQQRQLEFHDALSATSYQAEQAFDKICKHIQVTCPPMCETAQFASGYPSFEADDSADFKDQLTSMYTVTYKYAHLVDQFSSTLRGEGAYILTKLHNKLRSVLHSIERLDICEDLAPPSDLPDIIEVNDVTTRNVLNVRLLATLGHALQQMVAYSDRVLF